MSKRRSDVARIMANWQVKRDNLWAEQIQDELENQRRSAWQQAQYALLDSEANLTTRLGRRPSWEEMSQEYAVRLCAWVKLWDRRDLSTLQHLPLPPEEEQLHPGTSEARELAIQLVTLARLGKQTQVRNLFNQLRHDHLNQSQARAETWELRKRVLIWLHYRLRDAIIGSRKSPLERLEHTVYSVPKSTGGSIATPTIDDEDERILRALAKEAPRLSTQDTIEAASRVSRRTISKRMKTLLRDGLVARTKGPKQGTAITENGLNVLKQIDTAKLAQ